MRLSDAILMGDSLKKCSPLRWISADGSCGCALGGALLACGVDADEAAWQLNTTASIAEVAETPIIKALWPWLTGEQLHRISSLYCHVATGSGTIEDVADYVRTIEPGEEEYIPDEEPWTEYIPDEEPWTDSKTTAEMWNSIKGR